MKKYSEPKISLLVYVEEDILTESVLDATPVAISETTGENNQTVTLRMSEIILN